MEDNDYIQESYQIGEGTPKNGERFINIDFRDYELTEYDEFIELINLSAYNDKFYRILPVLLRTLFENLLYDTFQTGLNLKHKHFFFSKDQNRARDFSQLIGLLNVLKDKEFKSYHKDSINQNMITELKEIQNFGNWSVHQILRQVDKDFTDKWKQKINRVLLTILVLYKKLKNKSLEITDKETITKIYKTLNLEKKSSREMLAVQPESIGWKVVIQEEDRPIDVMDAIKFLSPDCPIGEILKLECQVRNDNWEILRLNLENQINSTFKKEKINRFAIFSIANISSAIYLGYLLTNRVIVRYTYFDRDFQTWKWLINIEQAKLAKIKVYGLLDEINQNLNEMLIKISLSTKILDTQIGGLGFNTENKIEITVDNPSEDWLRVESQIIELSRLFRNILANLRKNAPNLNIIHLFYAGPTTSAIAIGRQINPKMIPLIQLYEFDWNRRPNYRKSILIGGDQN